MAVTGSKPRSFDVPDILSFGFPLLNLFDQGKFPTPPNLSDIGLKPTDISSFFNFKRAVGRSGIQRQGAQASRVAAQSLPSSLQQSTVPASIQAGIQTKVGDQLANLESEILGQELNSKFQLFDVLQQQFMNQLEIDKMKNERKSGAEDALSLLPLFL